MMLDLIKNLEKNFAVHLPVGKKVLVLAERLKKKDAPGNLYKSTTENTPFIHRNEVFIVRKVVLTDYTYYYWILKTTDGDKLIDNRFLREELFALKNQFDE